ncbi:MAG: NAD-dependent epimerase/dehydratase family protein [Lentisphaerae bacterium]|nr:NAD-dependent epimerase/dehydratase family protein [Lentisphaerota bacterium]
MKKILIIGGSGHVSGAVVRAALAANYQVTTLTRGEKPAVGAVRELYADRHDAAAVAKAAEEIAGEKFAAVIDCIGFNAADMQQDLEVFAPLAEQLLFISTDWVYEPSLRRFPQPVDSPYITCDRNGAEGYGWGKLMAENYLREHAPENLPYTIFRPCHIYGMPSLLGCFPAHCRDAELIGRLLAKEPLQLVDNGRLLQQPIDCDDLAKCMISAVGNGKSYGKTFNMAGPDIVESREYYAIIARALGVELETEDIDFDKYLAENPAHRPFLCHRVYTLNDLKDANLYVPDTPLAEGLKRHTLLLRQAKGM